MPSVKCKSEFDNLNGDDDYLNFMCVENSPVSSLVNNQSPTPSSNLCYISTANQIDFSNSKCLGNQFSEVTYCSVD